MGDAVYFKVPSASCVAGQTKVTVSTFADAACTATPTVPPTLEVTMGAAIAAGATAGAGICGNVVHNSAGMADFSIASCSTMDCTTPVATTGFAAACTAQTTAANSTNSSDNAVTTSMAGAFALSAAAFVLA